MQDSELQVRVSTGHNYLETLPGGRNREKARTGHAPQQTGIVVCRSTDRTQSRLNRPQPPALSAHMPLAAHEYNTPAAQQTSNSDSTRSTIKPHQANTIPDQQKLIDPDLPTHDETSVPICRLPTEIIGSIAGLCGSTQDIVNLMKCNRHLHYVLGESLLHFAVQDNAPRWVIRAVYDGNLELLQALHRHGARLADQLGIDGWCYHPMELQYHIHSCKADPDFRLLPSFQALHVAAVRGHEHVVSWLVNQGAPLNGDSKMLWLYKPWNWKALFKRVNLRARTPLHAALCERHWSAAKTLMEKGAAADSLSSTRVGFTALHFALQFECLDLVKLVLEYGRCDLDAADAKGRTAIGLALSLPLGAIEFTNQCIRLLVAAGASPAVETISDVVPASRRDEVGAGNLSPLHLAVMRVNKEATLMLLGAGADVNCLPGGQAYLQRAFRMSSLHH